LFRDFQLFPATRVDFVMLCSEVGQYDWTPFTDTPDCAEEEAEAESLQTQMATCAQPEPGEPVLTFNVIDTVAPVDTVLQKWTPTYPCYLASLVDLDSDVSVTEFDLSYIVLSGAAADFRIAIGDGQFLPYAQNRIDNTYDLHLGDIVEWTFGAATIGMHPAHIHINPYQIISGMRDEPKKDADDDSKHFYNYFKIGDWHDTLLIPPGTYAQHARLRVDPKFRMQLAHYGGTQVQHCRIQCPNQTVV